MALEVVGAEISELVVLLNSILTSFCQLLALFVIAIGVSKALFIFLKDTLFRAQTSDAFQRSRLAMGYSFSLALSFLIGATIIAVRTLLNYLLLQAINSSKNASNPESNNASHLESKTVST